MAEHPVNRVKVKTVLQRSKLCRRPQEAKLNLRPHTTSPASLPKKHFVQFSPRERQLLKYRPKSCPIPAFDDVSNINQNRWSPPTSREYSEESSIIDNSEFDACSVESEVITSKKEETSNSTSGSPRDSQESKYYLRKQLEGEEKCTTEPSKEVHFTRLNETSVTERPHKNSKLDFKDQKTILKDLPSREKEESKSSIESVGHTENVNLENGDKVTEKTPEEWTPEEGQGIETNLDLHSWLSEEKQNSLFKQNPENLEYSKHIEQVADCRNGLDIPQIVWNPEGSHNVRNRPLSPLEGVLNEDGRKSTSNKEKFSVNSAISDLTRKLDKTERNRFNSLQTGIYLNVSNSSSSESFVRRGSTDGSVSSRDSRDSKGQKNRSTSPALLRRMSTMSRVAMIKNKERLKRGSTGADDEVDKRIKERAIEKFRRCATSVRVIAGICIALRSYVKEEFAKQWSLVEMHLNLRADMEKTLAFDPIIFSKLKVTKGSEKLRTILSQKPDKRSKDDVDVVIALLRNNKIFADYKRPTQLALAKVMEYQMFEPRRIVLKEGHVASGFYIILSGTCLINQKERDPRNGESFVRTVNEISAGEAFGEIGLLHDCPRTASVVCKDEVEVLLINKDDFIEIIKEPLERERQDLIQFCAEHFLVILDIDEKLRSNPMAIYTQIYKPGAMVSTNMYDSEYIFVIKSGKCDVLAEFKRTKFKEVNAKNLSKSSSIYDDSWKKTVAARKMLHLWSYLDHQEWADLAREQLYKEDMESADFEVEGIEIKEFISPMSARVARNSLKPPEMPKTIFQEGDKFSTSFIREKDNVMFETKDGVIRTWKRVTNAANALAEKERRKHSATQTVPPSTFAKVATLSTGSIFGLESILNPKQEQRSLKTNLSLRSSGAEIILVSKKFFNNSAALAKTLDAASKTISLMPEALSEKSVCSLMRQTVEYPTPEKAMKIIKQQRAWEKYKDDTLKQVYTVKAKRL